MCGCQQSRGGPAKASAKSTELYAMKAGPPIVKLFNIWHFMNKVALFNSQLCVGLDVWHKRFYVNQRTKMCEQLLPAHNVLDLVHQKERVTLWCS